MVALAAVVRDRGPLLRKQSSVDFAAPKHGLLGLVRSKLKIQYEVKTNLRHLASKVA